MEQLSAYVAASVGRRQLGGLGLLWPDMDEASTISDAVPERSQPTIRQNYTVAWATSAAEVRQAQRLRHQVFAREFGARLEVLPGTPAGLDSDRFDAHCSHLIVRADCGQVVATCRVMAPDAVSRVGGLYTESEFDLQPLRELLPRTLELGRVCVHRDWRQGLVVMAIWRAVGQKMAALDLESVIGCSSVSVADGGALAGQLWSRFQASFMAPADQRVMPRHPMPLALRPVLDVAIPPLIAGYLRCGCKVLGPPALDESFGTADFPMMLSLSQMPARYARRIFGS
jgi:putative hemolysin